MFLLSILPPPPLPGRRSASLWTSPLCMDVTEARTPPARSRDAAHSRAHRCCESGGDRRAHLGGTQHTEHQRRGEDRPVRVRQEPQTAGNHAHNESLRGQQDLKSCSPSIWALFLHFLSPLPPISPSSFDKEDNPIIFHLTFLSG